MSKHDYFIQIKSLVSWGMAEAFDPKLDKIMANIRHGRK